jgi:hypothetical protein
LQPYWLQWYKVHHWTDWFHRYLENHLYSEDTEAICLHELSDPIGGNHSDNLCIAPVIAAHPDGSVLLKI